MSKHVNFVCNDTLYSNIIEYMKENNIKNMSWAIRILIRHGLKSEEEEKEIEYIPDFSRYIDCLSSDDLF